MTEWISKVCLMIHPETDSRCILLFVFFAFFSSFLWKWIFLCYFHFHFVMCAFLKNIKKKSFLLSLSITLIASVYIFKERALKTKWKLNLWYDDNTYKKKKELNAPFCALHFSLQVNNVMAKTLSQLLYNHMHQVTPQAQMQQEEEKKLDFMF